MTAGLRGARTGKTLSELVLEVIRREPGSTVHDICDELREEHGVEFDLSLVSVAAAKHVKRGVAHRQKQRTRREPRAVWCYSPVHTDPIDPDRDPDYQP